MHTQQGRKGVNQDAMTLWKDFTGEKDTIFCGVFDGHGPLGHRVARHVRDVLPVKLSENSLFAACAEEEDDDGGGDLNGSGSVYPYFSSWKAGFLKAFKEVDDQLCRGANIDCICSGTTAVSVVKQNDHLMIANLGDSRAVLCTRDDSNQLSPIQLTVDLKPNLPNEASRIMKCKGRVFALEEEPEVHRVWLPDENCPGLAMARAFGDFCLKEFGIISTPQVTYRKLTERDEFVVLATDGVWDVLSNEEVVKIVSSARRRSEAAKKLVKKAVRAWEIKHPMSRIDDCAVVCLFLKPEPGAQVDGGKRYRDLSTSGSFTTAMNGEPPSPSTAPRKLE
ncbi:unnamed protein product [Spirodela intermedia]|uniref:protein-serine/threonine phosphatase n=1 Tax=Spirodela intermedia TaxID=51605 RepID=A0A7I8IAD6_SPIIN|nr:unnamed protein product [Spirodela intermedia]CAA6654686.1 unnamed protein product [Spirodela intermedia]